MSSPHFYQADQKFVNDVFGMRPSKEQHQTTIDINPVGRDQKIIQNCISCGNEIIFQFAAEK